MTIQQFFTLFRNHSHTGAYPDAVRLPSTALPATAFASAVVLVAPNGSRFILSVADDGALTTEPVAFSGVFISPGGRKFVLGVDSDGAPFTSPTNTPWSSMDAYDTYPLYDAVGTKFLLSVDNYGALQTAPA